MAVDRRFRQRHLGDNTVKTYLNVLKTRAGVLPGDGVGKDAAEMVQVIIENLLATLADSPIGTVLPARAAAKHFLVEELGLSEAEADLQLPKAKGKPNKSRFAMSSAQTKTFLALVTDDLKDTPVRALLLLLPRTGLRVSEGCQLRRENVVEASEGRTGLVFRGKGNKERYVPLGKESTRIFRILCNQATDADPWLFPGNGGEIGPITENAVRMALTRLRTIHPELGHVTPHVLRHTFATNALAAGVDIKSLQAILGHTSIKTTAVYLHPTRDTLNTAIDRLEG